MLGGPFQTIARAPPLCFSAAAAGMEKRLAMSIINGILPSLSMLEDTRRLQCLDYGIRYDRRIVHYPGSNLFTIDHFLSPAGVVDVDPSAC